VFVLALLAQSFASLAAPATPLAEALTPKAAPIVARAAFDCRVGKATYEDCQMVEESPVGLGAGAVAERTLSSLQPLPAHRAFLGQRVRVPFEFLGPVDISWHPEFDRGQSQEAEV
jgi:hypothetical protein